jgi:hypothetical protein
LRLWQTGKAQPVAVKQSGLDGRHRNQDGRVSQKHGNSRVGALRETYGDDFAAGHRADMKLSTLLRRERAPSLSQYLKGIEGVLGTTRDGVHIRKPKGSATHFSAQEVRNAVAKARGVNR